MPQVPHTHQNEDQCSSEVTLPCQFSRQEAIELHSIAARTEYVSFPKWALGLLITILLLMGGSHAALWAAFSTRAPATETTILIANLDNRITKVESLLPTSYPPVWFQKQFDDLSDTVLLNNRMLTDVRIELKTLAESNKNIELMRQEIKRLSETVEKMDKDKK